MFTNYEWLHTITFWVLYAALALATFVIIERSIFYARTSRFTMLLLAAMPHDIDRVEELPAELLDRDSVPTQLVREMLKWRAIARTRYELEDSSEAIFIDAKARLNRHLWILDTIVTAAPLLGLLGTILGIIDTFTALAQSGISDPAGVSAGIGTALFATALGISVALYGLIFHNAFQERVKQIGDNMKILLIRAGTHKNVAQLVAAE
jgi:biopolymer transport protein ExbB